MTEEKIEQAAQTAEKEVVAKAEKSEKKRAPRKRENREDKPMDEFDFQLNKMSVSGALFDMIKLLDVSKIAI